MKITFWIKTPAVLIIIAATNILSISQAADNASIGTQRILESSELYQSLTQSLEDNGLERETAVQMTQKVFATNANHPDQMLRNLLNHPVLRIDETKLMKCLSKRALYSRIVDLRNYHSLTGLVQDIKGHTLSEYERQAIHDVVMMNQLFRLQCLRIL